jgi:dienelactone hydrolase
MACVRATSLCVTIVAATLASGAMAALRETIESPVIEGTVQRYLVAQDDLQPVSRVVVVFPGGDGHLGLTSEPPPANSGAGFMAALRRTIARPGTAMVLVDSPARQPSMPLEYRESAEYRALLQALFAHLRRRFAGAQFYAVGYSNGAVSALLAGREPGVSGVILISGIFRRYADLASFGVQVPILVIHHEADRCIPPEFDESFRMMLSPTFVRSIARPYGPSPCGVPSAHQFDGQEDAVAEVLHAWLATGRAPSRIR